MYLMKARHTITGHTRSDSGGGTTDEGFDKAAPTEGLGALRDFEKKKTEVVDAGSAERREKQQQELLT